MCLRGPSFGQNRKSWHTQKSYQGSPHHNYSPRMLLNASVCLFGSWTQALKGATSQFAMGWHLTQALNVSESVEFRSKSRNLDQAKVVPRFPTPQLRTKNVDECFCLSVWAMDTGSEGCYITICHGMMPRSGFECVQERQVSVKIKIEKLGSRESCNKVPHTTTTHQEC